MAKYTVELNELTRSTDFQLFDFLYPFYAVEKDLPNAQELKNSFENNFIKHFYFREICAETVGRWKIYVENFFNTHMPYYNMLYISALMEYDLNKNYDITETITRDIENSGELSGNAQMSGDVKTNSTENSNSNNEQNVEENNENNIVTTNIESGSEIETDDTKNSTNTNTEVVEKEIDPSQGALSTSLENYATKAKTQKASGTAANNYIDIDGTKTKTFNNRKTENETENIQNNTSKITNENEANNEQEIVQITDNTAINHETTTNTQSEIYERKMFGDMSLRTLPEAIQTHIKLQEKLKTIENQIYNQAEILFMQIY